jgi:hypothetical protein
VFKQELTKFDLVDGDIRINYLDKANLNPDNGMMYFIYFDGVTGLDTGRYTLEIITKSGLNLKSISTLNVQPRNDVQFKLIAFTLSERVGKGDAVTVVNYPNKFKIIEPVTDNL